MAKPPRCIHAAAGLDRRLGQGRGARLPLGLLVRAAEKLEQERTWHVGVGASRSIALPQLLNSEETIHAIITQTTD